MTYLEDLPPQIRFFIQKCTKFNPAERFQNLEEFKETYFLIKDHSDLNINIYPNNDNTAYHIIELLEQTDLFSKFPLHKSLKNKTIDIIFTDLPVEFHSKLFSLNASLYLQFVNESIEEIRDKGYQFSYVDNILSTITIVLDEFKNIWDIDLQAKLIVSGIRVSVFHSRFNAMWQIGRFISTMQNPVLIAELRRLTNNEDIEIISDYHDSINLQKLLL